jgi:hypothetical protein
MRTLKKVTLSRLHKDEEKQHNTYVLDTTMRKTNTNNANKT